MEKYVLIIFVIVCAVLLVISLRRKKMELFINFVLRLITGAVGIYLINALLGLVKIESAVGLNGVNMLVVGALGIPGLVLLYSVGVYFMFRA